MCAGIIEGLLFRPTHSASQPSQDPASVAEWVEGAVARGLPFGGKGSDLGSSSAQ